MSKIAIQGNASGTGTLTIAAPNTNTDRTLTLPDQTGTIITTAGGQAVAGTTGTFTGLLDISAAGAGQIKFPATQNASTDANTLDDYEEGSWTPAITFGGGSTGIAYSAQVGNYTKIGQMVYLQFRITLSSKGSSTGSAALGGMPFTTGGTYSQGYIIHDNTANFNSGWGMYWGVENGSTSGPLRQIGTNGSSALDETRFNNNTLVTGILVYRV